MDSPAFDRKAQITAFIIIGLIVLIGIGALLFLIYQQSVPTITYPAEVQPVANFVADCVKQAAEGAVTLVGQQGGYAELPPDIAHELGSHLALDELGMRKVPFWFYQGQSRIPSLSFVQAEISRYVEKKASECAQFDGFPQFKIDVLEPMKAETTLGDDVVVQATFPLKITVQNNEFLVEDYLAIVPVPLKQVHELAVNIIESENKQTFMENMTVDLMAADPEVPMDGLELDCSPERWNVRNIKQRMERVLQQNIPNTRVKSTQISPFQFDEDVYEDLREKNIRLQSELESGLEELEESPNAPALTPPDAWEYFHQYVDVGAQPSDLRVLFQFLPEWRLTLLANPSDGGILSSNTMGGTDFLRFLCINQYHFTYDVFYPVRVVIQDPDTQYFFEFAFPVIVDDNNPSRNVLDFRSFDDPFPINEFCDERGSQTVEFRARGFTAPELPPVELDDVQISYTCFNNRCSLGKTEADGGLYRLRTQVPPGCSSPLIRAEKEGYLPAEEFLKANSIILDLPKLKTLNVQVVKHPYFPADNALRSPEPLRENEHASLLLKAVGRKHEEFMTLPTTEQIGLVEATQKYNIDLTLFRENTVVGGYHAKNITIPFDALVGANTVTFHVFEQRPAEGVLDTIFGQAFKEELKPTLS